MKRVIVTLAICMLVAASASAQVSKSASITVTAANGGVFNFTINSATFAFGTVDSNGTTSTGSSTPGVRNGTPGTGATYTANAATTWTVQSAPQRTVRIYNSSSASTINWGVADRLQMRIPNVGTGTTCNLLTFSTTGDGGAGACASGNLLYGLNAGNGASAVTGNLDFVLTVLDTDAIGTNTWTVQLTAAAP